MLVDIVSLFLISLLISVSTFGGGSQALFYQYGVLQNQWISSNDLSAILAFGYTTPGPAVFGTASFIGYSIAGIPGALLGTLGIFIVSFTLAILASKYLSNILTKPIAEYAIQGIGLAAAGLVAATALGVLPLDSIMWWQAIFFVLATGVSLRWKTNPLYILLVCGVAGVFL